MSETVIRHRGGGYDDDGNPTGWSDFPLVADRVAPGATAEYVDRGRDGQTIAMSVYFRRAVDLTNDDQVTVRGDRYLVQVESWTNGRRTATVALCSSGKG